MFCGVLGFRGFGIGFRGLGFRVCGGVGNAITA